MDQAKELPSEIVAKLLKQALMDKQSRNSEYSARALARDAKISPAFLNMVMKGKRHLSIERAACLADLLNFPTKKRASFLRAATLAAVPGLDRLPPELSELIFQVPLTQNYIPIEIDQFQFFSQWYHVAILDLTTCSNFKSDIGWIARRLGLDLSVAKDSISRLLRLGLLELKSGSLQKTKSFLSIPNNSPRGIIRNFHFQMIEKAKESLTDQTPTAFAKRYISGITLAINPARVAEAKVKMDRFKREMSEFLSDGDCTEVYQMNLQFFPLTKEERTSE